VKQSVVVAEEEEEERRLFLILASSSTSIEICIISETAEGNGTGFSNEN
jgi:hypothetical protein